MAAYRSEPGSEPPPKRNRPSGAANGKEKLMITTRLFGHSFRSLAKGLAACALIFGLTACASNSGEQRSYVAKGASFSQMMVAIVPF